MTLTLRDATPSDAPLIAWVQVEAARSGTPLGFWDLALPGPDEPRLALIAEIATSTRAHFGHWSGFLVAELDGTPIGALSGYAPGVKKIGHFAGAVEQTLERRGWSEAHRRLLWLRVRPCEACFSDTPEDRWVVEWVALRPEARGKGVAVRLLREILDRGRAAAFAKAQISYLVGNTPAQRPYERVGFVEIDRKTDPQFEEIAGAPGTVRMGMDL
jgi:ribosomal protein S18 acetylase RimI-like enzyme